MNPDEFDSLQDLRTSVLDIYNRLLRNANQEFSRETRNVLLPATQQLLNQIGNQINSLNEVPAPAPAPASAPRMSRSIRARERDADHEYRY